ncbi:MAG: DUF2237 domain-containing protein [Thiotrichales bacterium]|jgi:hypothetical protein|nr:DUF2237 domain-containing protein [Thiotrichales bacterium]
MTGKLNLLGEPLLPCSHQPLTGYFRDGYCRTDAQDRGRHVVCAQVTEAFLAYSKTQGNDLITPQLGFPGLKPGDYWCLCALRWLEAFEAGVAPPIVFAATDQALLSYVELKVLQSFALDKTI